MIGKDAIDAAVARLNPLTAATNTTVESFGAEEARTFMRHTCEQVGVDYEALMELGGDVMAEATESRRANPWEYAQGHVQGFLHGVLAAREASAERG